MFRIVFVSFILFPFSLCHAADLQIGRINSLEGPITNLKLPDRTGSYIVARPSKFVLLDDSDADSYLIGCVSVYSLSTYSYRNERGESPVISTVRKDEAYLLPKKYNGANIKYLTASSYLGPVSGPFIVPFKIRFEDDSVS